MCESLTNRISQLEAQSAAALNTSKIVTADLKSITQLLSSAEDAAVQVALFPSHYEHAFFVPMVQVVQLT